MKRTKLLRRTPLAKMSSNKARETAKYWPLRRKFIEDHPFCEFPVSRPSGLPPFIPTVSCIMHTASIHHQKGQHWKIMNDTSWWLPVCAKHHAWIEDHKNEAREMGLILYK